MSLSTKSEVVFDLFKKIFKWTAFTVLAGVVLSGFLVAYYDYQNYQKNKPKKIFEYAELKIGESQEHVKYVLGEPSEFLLYDDKKPEKLKDTGFRWVYKNDENNGKIISKSDVWFYKKYDHMIVAEFDKPGGVISAIGCISEGNYNCPIIFGLQDGSDEELVLKQLGKPDEETIVNSTKVMNYDRYNIELRLQKKKVYLIKVIALTDAKLK